MLSVQSLGDEILGDEILYRQDFSSDKEENYDLKGGAEVKDGRLVSTQGRVDLFFTSDVPAHLSFKVRELEILPGADHHWGLHLQGGDGYRCHVYTRGTGGVISALTRHDDKVGTASGGQNVVVSRGQDAPWSTVDIYIGRKNFGVSIDNQSCIVQEVSLLPLRKVSFYGYRVKFEIDDVIVKPLKERAVTLIEEPVFSASFDGTLDAQSATGDTISPMSSVGSRFVPGVSGQGFAPGQALPPVGLKAFPGEKWQITGNERYVGEDGGTLEIGVPYLDDFVLEADFQRLGNVPKADHHFNLHVAAKGKHSVGLHVRDNSWHYRDSRQAEPGYASSFTAQHKVNDNVDEAPVRLQLIRIAGQLTLTLDGQPHALGKADIGPVTAITFNGYGVAYSIDNLKVTGGDFELAADFAEPPPAQRIPGIDYLIEKPFDDKVGGVSFWARSNDGRGFDAFVIDGETDASFRASLKQGATFRVTRTDSEQGLYYMRRLGLMPGDWYHVVLTWEEGGNARLFVNGLPYPVSFTPGQRCPLFFNADLDGIERLIMGRQGDFTLDELKLYHRPLSNLEVYREYRSVMPIDLVMERSIIEGSKREPIVLQAAPGGYYMRPYPVPGQPFVSADVTLKLDLFDSEDQLLTREQKALRVDRPMDVSMQGIELPVGNYRLVATIEFGDKTFQRTFEVASFTEQVASEVTKAPYQLGETLFEKQFSDPADPELISEGTTVKRTLAGVDYLEAGANKRDRFASIVSFPASSIGQPVALEIAWPDDKVRNMSLYMYKESKGRQHRDRLQSGVQAGNEYPNSHSMQTARYIFYPAGEHYLFEARTLAPDCPAAVSNIRVREIVGGLPRLAIHYPEGMEGRHFGHFDEDQTFTTNLRVDNELPPEFPRRTLMQNDDLMRYFDYTGQNTMHYPTWRYSYSFNPLEGSLGNGMYPGKSGELSYVFDSFHRHNKKYVAMINFFTLPEMSVTDAIQYDFAGQGMLSLNRFGNEVVSFGRYKAANIAHPEVRRMFIDYFRDTVQRYADHPGFGGLQWWMHFGLWRGLDCGYDDYTVNAFAADTGIQVPANILERYDVLTQEPVRSEWLKWRARQVTAFINEMRAMLDEYNPELKLNLLIPQEADVYAEKGADFDAIKQIDRVALVAERSPTTYRWHAYWGKPEPTIYEEMYDADAPMISDFMVDGAVGAVVASNVYFESFNDSLMPERFAAYFQNADPKQHGRFFLKEPAFAVGAMDALEFVIGGQPLGTLGRDAETREFTQAYCALPAQPFNTVPGVRDPAVVRYLHTANGTYFYAVNMHHSPVEVRIDFARTGFLGLGRVNYLDLSTDTTYSDETVELLPFQLRSFLIPGKEVDLLNAELAAVPPETDAFYAKRVGDLKLAIQQLERNGVDVTAEREVLAAIHTALAARHYAEAHRLAFSKRMNQVFRMVGDIGNIARRQQLVNQGIFRVNCGSTAFYEAPNGKLLFPDQPYDGLYGYVGNYNSVGREIGELKGTDMPEVFRTEAYDIDGYQFKLPNGTYKAVLHLKCGYKPGFKKGIFEFSVKANDEMALYKYDLYTATEGDFDQTLTVEIEDIEVTDGMLRLEFVHHPSATSTGNGTARLANVIEIMPEAK